MRICIYGAGAIGAWLGAELSRAGEEVTLIARGAHLAAMQANDRFDRPDDYVSDLKQKYQGVSLDAIRAAARQVLHPGLLTWVVVGDRKVIEEDLRELGIGEIRFIDVDGNAVD